MSHSDLLSHPDPAANYAEAVERIEAWVDQTPADILPEGRLQFLSHGRKADRAVAFVHGYTNCP